MTQNNTFNLFLRVISSQTGLLVNISNYYSFIEHGLTLKSNNEMSMAHILLLALKMFSTFDFSIS